MAHFLREAELSVSIASAPRAAVVIRIAEPALVPRRRPGTEVSVGSWLPKTKRIPAPGCWDMSGHGGSGP